MLRSLRALFSRLGYGCDLSGQFMLEKDTNGIYQYD